MSREPLPFRARLNFLARAIRRGEWPDAKELADFLRNWPFEGEAHTAERTQGYSGADPSGRWGSGEFKDHRTVLSHVADRIEGRKQKGRRQRAQSDRWRDHAIAFRIRYLQAFYLEEFGRKMRDTPGESPVDAAIGVEARRLGTTPGTLRERIRAFDRVFRKSAPAASDFRHAFSNMTSDERWSHIQKATGIDRRDIESGIGRVLTRRTRTKGK